MENDLFLKIDNAEIVSFDIFDTLLIRPFLKPVDVFCFLGNIKNKPEFYQKRIVAERKAFEKYTDENKEDVTFDEIYSLIDKEYKGFYNLELDFEKDTIQQNPEMKEVFDYALSKNKKVIITSDMYLSKEYLENLLKLKGFCGFDKLYVSNTYFKTKRNGTLYQVILDENKVEPKKILHIGDNFQSDIQAAQSAGIETFYYKAQRDIFLEKFPYYKGIVPDISNYLGLQILNSEKLYEKNYWHNVGYRFGGPLILSFVNEVIKVLNARKIKDVFFVARDSWIVNEAFKTINKNPELKSHYVYASRILKQKYYNEKTGEVDRTYADYVKSIKLQENRVLIADTCADSFSAQRLISTALEDVECLGCYLTNKLNYEFNYVNLSNSSFPTTFPGLFLELLCSSFEAPIIDIVNNKPVYKETITPEAEYKNKIFKDIVDGEMEFIRDYLEIFGDYSISIQIDKVFNYIGTWWKNLTKEDKKHLESVKMESNPEQTETMTMDVGKNPIFAKLREKMLKNKK